MRERKKKVEFLGAGVRRRGGGRKMKTGHKASVRRGSVIRNFSLVENRPAKNIKINENKQGKYLMENQANAPFLLPRLPFDHPRVWFFGNFRFIKFKNVSRL